MKLYTILPITIAALIATPTILAAPIAGTVFAPAAALDKRDKLTGAVGNTGLLGSTILTPVQQFDDDTDDLTKI